MKWIRKIKDVINRKKNFENKNSHSKNGSSYQSQEKNIQRTAKEKSPRYEYENFRKLKVYKRPVITDADEREELFHKISEELRDLDY